jgi:hypothetical protein
MGKGDGDMSLRERSGEPYTALTRVGIGSP